LRSSWIFRRELYDEHKIEFERALSPTGFREETIWSLRALMAGYKLFVDTGAICWHLACPSGGVKSADYAQRVASDDMYLRRWIKLQWQLGRLKKEMFEV
jgi:hypothetical protein